MPSTYEPIATQTLGSAAASVTFSSISGSYTDLILISNVQATLAGEGVVGVLNSDTGANYSFTVLRGNGSSAASARVTGASAVALNNISEPPTSGSFGLYIAHFMNYSNTTTFKTVLARGNNANNAVDTEVSLWRNTAAITSIRVQMTGGNLNTGSSFTLYGVKSA